MWQRYIKLWHFFVFAFLILIPAPLLAQDDETPPPFRLDILGIDDRNYPEINLYTTVTDTQNAQPITNLDADDFSIIAESEFPLAISDFHRQQNRPVHLMLVLDLTSSVSMTELNNMRSAGVSLIEQLSPEDQVGVLRMDHISTSLLQPLTHDHNAAINVMFSADVVPVENQVGNVVLDGLYNAISNITLTSPDVRPIVVMLTDVTSGSVGGQQSIEDVQALAEQRGTTIYILYFETDNDEGFPIRDNPPEDLQNLANTTGGLLLEREGVVNPELEGDYNDDQYLVNLALRVADFIVSEYQLTVNAPITGDNQIYELELSALVQNTQTNLEAAFFRARSGTIEIIFSNLINGQRVELPLEIELDIVGDNTSIQQIQLYRLDNSSGAEILIATLDGTTRNFVLLPESIPSGMLNLIVRAVDSDGNRGEALVTLTVQALQPSPSATLAQPRATSTETQTPTPTAVAPTNTLISDDALATTTALVGIPVTLPVALSQEPNAVVETTPPDDNEPPSNGTSILIPIIVAMIGMFGTLLIGFSLLSIISRRNTRQASATRQTLPRKSSIGKISSNSTQITSESIEQTIKLENTPDKEMWKKIKAMEITSRLESTTEEPRTLAFLTDVSAQQQYALIEGENTIGRHSTNHVQLKDSAVSRYHAVIEIFDNNALIMDWQSSHPTLLNHVALEKGKRHPLQNGDQIQLGNTILTFMYS